MPETYADDNGQRVIIRHTGPAGRGIPAGGTTGQILVKDSGSDYASHWADPPDGTDAVAGPFASVNNNVVVFDGVSGKAIKDGGHPLSYYASNTALATKVDKIDGKGLSDENFTSSEKDKLAGLSSGGFRGSFEDRDALDSNDFDPVPQPGDYCYIEATGDDIIEVLWDSINEEWTEQTLEPVTMTGGEIATALFETTDAASYSQANTRIFTTSEKAQLALLTDLSGIVRSEERL